MDEILKQADEVVRPLDWSPSDFPSLASKVVLITGANSMESIGGNIAYELALKGAKVYIGARNLEKANAGIKAMLAKSPSIKASNLKPFVADVSNYKEVNEATEKFLQEEQRLDILVNNAGILPPKIEFDSYGVSKIMAANHLGHFLLTNKVLPLLEKAAKEPGSDVRIVNVSSSVHYLIPAGTGFSSLKEWSIDFGEPENQTGAFMHYGYSKVANILFTKELQQRFDQKGIPIVVTAPHPGSVATPGAGRFQGTDSDAFKNGLTAYVGSTTPLWCAAHPEVRQDAAKFKGKFITKFGGLKEPTELAQSGKEAKGLWATSEAILKEVFPGQKLY